MNSTNSIAKVICLIVVDFVKNQVFCELYLTLFIPMIKTKLIFWSMF